MIHRNFLPVLCLAACNLGNPTNLPVSATPIAGAANQPAKVTQAPSFARGVVIAHWADHLFPGRVYGDPKWFARDDVKWIKNAGFDHVWIRVSGKEISNEDGTLNPARLQVLDDTIAWGTEQNIGVVLALMDVGDTPKIEATTDTAVRERTLQSQRRFWSALSQHFANHNPILRFAIHNAPKRLTTDPRYLNQYNATILAQVRKSHPLRTIYLSAPSIDTLARLQVPSDDYIAISVSPPHDVFSKQWMQGDTKQGAPVPVGFPKIPFPGQVPDLSNIVDSDSWALQASNARIDSSFFVEQYSRMDNWRKAHAPGAELYVSHWGYYSGFPTDAKANEDRDSIINYAFALSTAANKFNISWSLYDYNSGMSVHNTDGGTSPLVQGLARSKQSRD